MLLLPNPYASQVPLAIVSVKGVASVAQYGQAEYVVRLTGSYRDPFDPAEVALDASVRTPSGRRLAVPGFLYRPYSRTIGPAVLPVAVPSTAAVKEGRATGTRSYDAAEIMSPAGSADWRVRFAPTEPGMHRIEFTLRTRQGVVRRGGTKLMASPAKGGFVRISPRDGRYFAVDDGTPYWPLGANTAWAGPRGLKDFEDWLPAYGKAGANWGRVWLSPAWTTFGLEQIQVGQIDLGQAWRLDQTLALAQKNGIRLALCIDSYNILRDRVSWPEWERSPLNQANGGPLARPADFWTSSVAERLYRNRLRYLVARWGADTATMAWEFWNEVDGTADYKAAPIREWHARMVRVLRSIDPYRHPITTSFGGSGEGAEDRSIFALPELDYTQSHRYDDPDIALGVVRAQERLGSLGKPHFVGEVGADASGDRRKDDPRGYQIHDPLWASVAIGAAGGAMPWWWDSYIGPNNLYPLFGNVARFVKDVDFDREGFRRAKPSIRYSVPPKTWPRRDAVPTADGVGWKPADHFRPQTVTVDERGMKAPRLGHVQQGVGNHPELHNPVTFETNLPWPTRLVVSVGDVSGYGGATLRLTLDGKTMQERAFPDPDGDRDPAPLKQFAGDYMVEIPAGRHTAAVENVGQDWFVASYRLVDALERRHPPLVAWATVGRRAGIAWIRHEDRTWRNEVTGMSFPPIPPSMLSIPGLAPGAWRVEFWDTWQGRIASQREIVVPKSGIATFPLPPFKRDLAVKLVRRPVR